MSWGFESAKASLALETPGLVRNMAIVALSAASSALLKAVFCARKLPADTAVGHVSSINDASCRVRRRLESDTRAVYAPCLRRKPSTSKQKNVLTRFSKKLARRRSGLVQLRRNARENHWVHQGQDERTRAIRLAARCRRIVASEDRHDADRANWGWKDAAIHHARRSWEVKSSSFRPSSRCKKTRCVNRFRFHFAAFTLLLKVRHFEELGIKAVVVNGKTGRQHLLRCVTNCSFVY